jgi:EpsI family protein
MVLLAHGDTQSNSLQLHRPEVCYPAFGFEISGVSREFLRLAPGASLPSTRLVADAPGRRENIVYWTRLGDFLPTTGAEQRLDRIRTVVGGYIADGLLARFSVVADDSASAFATAAAFVSRFVRAVAPAHRPALIGSRLAAAIANLQS